MLLPIFLSMLLICPMNASTVDNKKGGLLNKKRVSHFNFPGKKARLKNYTNSSFFHHLPSSNYASTIKIKHNSGFGVEVKPIDHPNMQWLKFQAGMEPDTNRVIGELLSRKLPGNVIIDGGAFVGDTTLFMAMVAQKHNPNITVVAIDPDPKNMDFLQKIASENNLHNIIAVTGALGDKNTHVTLTDAHPCMKKVIEDPKKKGVRMYTLDSLLDELDIPYSDIGFIHYDLEGYEWNALLGSQKTLSLTSADLMLELWPTADTFAGVANAEERKQKALDRFNETKEQVGEFLSPMGYKFVQTTKEHGNTLYSKTGTEASESAK